MIQDDTISQIRDIDIADIWQALGYELKPRNQHCFGSSHKHGDKNPSLSFDKKTNQYKCFGCDLGGDTIDLVMQANSVGFKEATQWIGDKFSVDISTSSMKKVDEYANNQKTAQRALKQLKTRQNNLVEVRNTEIDYKIPFSSTYQQFYDLCEKPNEELISWWTERNLSDDLLAGAGWRSITDQTWKKVIKEIDQQLLEDSGIIKDVDGKKTATFGQLQAIVPFFDTSGDLIYIRARNLKDHAPKYLPPVNSSPPIYNYQTFIEWLGETPLFITESETDCLALTQLGHTAIAFTGASISPNSLTVRELLHMLRTGYRGQLRKLEINIVTDKDEAGEKFYTTLETLLNRIGIKQKNIHKWQCKDEYKDISEQVKNERTIYAKATAK